MAGFEVRSKTWLEIDGRPFLGGGRLRLLEAVQRNGSISAAARDLGISYRKAWAQLQALEEVSPLPLLERRSGGRGGGQTRLTPEALKLIERFERLRRETNKEVDRIYAECFAQQDIDDGA